MPRPLRGWQHESQVLVDSFIADIGNRQPEDLDQEGIVSRAFDATGAVYKFAKRRNITPPEQALKVLDPKSREIIYNLLSKIDWNGVDVRAAPSAIVSDAMSMFTLLRDQADIGK